ncbi:MAG: DNA primase [Candidatus Sericytochromatia bacterium]|nr:DNA primase [Candidatus Sericytochromatia bacterium]
MNLIPDDPIAEIRARADIVEVISERVVLKRSGRNLLGLCPFHQERTPSFNVNPERQIFRCFGCGEGGDVFTFVMKTNGMTFPEALRSLAERYGITLPERSPQADERQRILEANEAAAGYFSWLLEHEDHGRDARAYLSGRGIDATWRKRFRLGLSPNGWDGLHRHLLGRQVPLDVQEQAALVRRRQSQDGCYDYFRNRIMFPILNEATQVVGFGARALGPNDEPKYLNSPDTLVYRKGNLLYGLSEAREAMKQRDRVILVEGYLDVLTAHLSGFEETVGVLGTALTPQQARALLRYTPSRRVTLAFDADRAGLQAAERGIATLSEVTQGVGLEVRVLAVPSGKDPDAFLRQEGAAAFDALLSTAPSLFEFLLNRAIAPHDPSTPEGRTRAVAAAVPILRQIESYVTQDHHVTWLSERLQTRPETLRLELGKGTRQPGSLPARVPPPPAKKLSTREAERLLLYHMVEHPSARADLREKLANVVFSPVHQAIREALAQLDAEGVQPIDWSLLLARFSGELEIHKALSALSFEDYAAWGRDLSEVVEDCILTLEIDYWQAHKLTLTERIKRGDQVSEAETRRLQEIVLYLVSLDKKRRKMAPSVDEKSPQAGT